jgi:transglutaminase-like putative cysteine protease
MPRKSLRLFLLALMVSAGFSVRADDKVQPADFWDAVFLGNDKVGYVHTLIRPTREDGKDLVRVQVETVMNIKRFNDSVEMKLDYSSIETPAGKVLSLDNRGVAGVESRTTGVAQGNSMVLTMETSGKKSTLTIPWGDDVLGPGAEDRLLKHKPLKAGEQLSYRSFMPDLNRIITNVYYGEEMEDVKMLDGNMRHLQRVRAQIDGIPELKNFKTYLWVDENGDTQKTITTMMAGMTTYRVSKEVATAPSAVFSADFGAKTLVKIDRQIPNAFYAEEIVYRVTVKDESPDEVFPQDERQSITKGENGQWLLTIHAIDPSRPPKTPTTINCDDFLRSTNYLQTDDPKVIAAARQAVGDAKDPWEQTRRIEKWVYTNVASKNFSKVFDSAAVVAEKLEGDCTEHGVLLAAMARVVGIPSRVAVGLVYAERLGAFGYHMWAEVYVGGRWVPVDGTLGLGHASPAHIKLADASLDGADAMVAFLPVARVMDRLKIEVVSWKH